jgi:quinolinate synthase
MTTSRPSLTERIADLRRARHAVILAHNYTLPEVQNLADVVGDSLELALRAAKSDAEVIVLCGVRFMAETAKLLNPERRVLMPDLNAGCPMADTITAAQLRDLKAQHPGCAVVCYVNTTAAVKAESDLCCTSANAVAVVESLPRDRAILFVPDKNLGRWVERQAGRELVRWDGSCPIHALVRPEAVREARRLHPRALVAAHPECPETVLDLADFVGSTSRILAFCRESAHDEFVIATERGILHRLALDSPAKTFHEPSPPMTCPNMKLATAENVLWCLEDLKHEITVDAGVAARARLAIERMFDAAPRPGGSR